MTEEIVLWYNPGCSKSRAAREILEQAGAPFRLRHYLDEPPTRAELEDLLTKLGVGPRAVARTKEAAWQAAGLDEAGDDDVLAALIATPALLERPIAVRGRRAVIARPPERLRLVL